MPLTQEPVQHSTPLVQGLSLSRHPRQMPPSQIPLQHSVSTVQALVSDRHVAQMPLPPPLGMLQNPPQQSLSTVQSPPVPRQHVPLFEQKALQHSLPLVQVRPISRHPVAGAQVPPEQLPLQHCVFFLHAFPSRLQPGGAAPALSMPRDASVLPTSAAPINLSALLRDISPLASPLASASKERSPSSGGIDSPYLSGGWARQSRRRAGATTLTRASTRPSPLWTIIRIAWALLACSELPGIPN
jgi:hypothetical protein